MTALWALGIGVAQTVLSCMLIFSVFVVPAHAQPTPVPSPTPNTATEPSQDVEDAPDGTAGGLAGGVAAGLANRALDSLFETIGEAAVWAFGKVVGWVDATSSPDVTQPWFSEIYGRTYWLSATIALIALVWALTTGALRGGVTGMLGAVPRLLFVVVGLAIAVPIVQTLLEFTDWLTARVGGEVGENMQQMTSALGAAFAGGAGAAGLARSGGVPGFVLGLVALIIVVGSLLVWLQLVLRAAVIYLLLAAAAFPAAMSINRTSTRPIRKVIAWIVAMAFAKPVIMLALWIGSAPFTGGSDADVVAVLTGAGIMVTAVFAPWGLFRLFDFAGEQVASAVSAPPNPAQLRIRVEHPITTYRRTGNAVQERAMTVREHSPPSFSPTRPRAATVTRQAATPSTAIGAASLAASGGIAAARTVASHARRAVRATEPGDPSTANPESATTSTERAPGSPPDRRAAEPPRPRPPPRPSERHPQQPSVKPRGADDDG